MKSLMKRADRTGAKVALIIGGDELVSGTVTVKPLRGQGEQQRLGRGALNAALTAVLDAPVADTAGA